jgi:hypothetical protein
MKKQNLVLGALLLVGVLSACGAKPLNQDEGIAQVKKIQAYRADSSFDYPSDKTTFTTTMSGLGSAYGNKRTETRLIKGSYVYINSTITGASDSATNKDVKNYVYSQNGKYYNATQSGESKTYTELSKTDFDAAIAAKQAGILKQMTTIADAVYSTLDPLLATLTSSSDTSSEASSITSKTTFTSKGGDGNLTITTERVEKDSENDVSGTSVVSFEANFPVKLTDHTKGTAIVASSTETLDSDTEVDFVWNSASPVYPDLSQFTAR